MEGGEEGGGGSGKDRGGGEWGAVEEEEEAFLGRGVVAGRVAFGRGWVGCVGVFVCLVSRVYWWEGIGFAFR